MYSIGIFTNEISLKKILELDKIMASESQVTYLPYTSPDHLRFLYKENQGNFDGLLFSGSYPYNIIRKYDPQIDEVPHAYFDLSALDYYKSIAQLAVQNPKLDFKRVYFDRPQIPVDFESIFHGSDAPRLGTASIDWLHVDALDWYKPLQSYYKEVWDSGEIDLMVTRFASMAEYFCTHKIKHFYLAPSKETMQETYQKLLEQLKTKSIRETAACIALVASPQKLDTSQMQMLWNGIQGYNKQCNLKFLAYQQTEWIELTTNIAILKEVTQQYTVSPMAAYLSEYLPFPVCIGWGCASDVTDAHRNGYRALKHGIQSGEAGTYVVTEDNTLIGPLSSSRRVVCSDVPNPLLIRAGERVGISPLYLSKIASVLQQKGDYTLSSEELAYFLNVTTRSASRILNKLETGGLAKVEYSRQLNLRGRPAKIYCIDYDTLLGRKKWTKRG